MLWWEAYQNPDAADGEREGKSPPIIEEWLLTVTIPNMWFVGPDTANEEGKHKDVKNEGYEL